MLQVQDKAPDFHLQGSDGKAHSLSDANGKAVLVYFYPKDNTPGCTTEACDFRDNMEHIASKNCIVYGISKDKIDSHINFRDKYNLNFVLLSDPELKMHLAYHALEDGKTVRSTFLIDRTGNIAKIWPKVSVKGHVDAVLKAIEAL